MQDVSVEPGCNEGPRDWENVFVIMRFHYNEILLHILYYQWGKEKTVTFICRGSLNRGSTVLVTSDVRLYMHNCTCKQLVDGLQMFGLIYYFLLAGFTEFVTGKMEQLISLLLPFKIVY